MNRILHPLATLLVLALAVFAAVAAMRTGLFAHAMFQPSLAGHVRGVAGVLLAVAVVVGVARWRNASRAQAALVLAVAVALVFNGIGAVATVALALVSSFCLGRRALPAKATAEPGGAAIAVAIGLGALALAVGVLSFFPVASAATYLALMALPVAWGFRDSRAALQAAWDAQRATAAPARSIVEDLLAIAIGTALALQAIAVLQPEFGFDALHVHLAFVDQLRLYGRAEYDVNHFVWAVMPMGADWAFALVGLPGGEAAARLLNFAGEATLLALLHGYVAPRAGRPAALLAIALYVLTPLVYLETTSLYIDTLWALWLVASVACAARTLDEGDARWVLASAVLFGAAMSAKVIAVYSSVFLVATAIAWIVRRRPTLLRDLALAAGGIAAFGALPYVNAWVRTGNPVFPFFNDIFKSPLYAPIAFDNELYHQPLTWRLLYDMTFGSKGFLESTDGALGLLWFVLLPPAALLAWRAGRRHAAAFGLAVVVVLAVFASQSYLRYILPMFALLSALVALALAPWAQARLSRAVLGTVVAAGTAAGLVLYFSACWPYRSLRMPPGPDAQARREFARGINDERLVPAVLDALQLRQVLWLGKPLLAGSHARIELVSWVAPGNLKALAAARSREEVRAWIAERNFDSIVVAPAKGSGGACQSASLCDFIKQDTTPVFNSGDVTVYQVNPDVLFDHELLANPGFDGGASGWAATGPVDPKTGRLHVLDQSQKASQRVAVQPGAKYWIAAQVACVQDAEPGQLRLQVNWLDAHDALLAVSLRPVDCTPLAPAVAALPAPAGPTPVALASPAPAPAPAATPEPPAAPELPDVGMTLVAPAGASFAVVHVSGHVPGQAVDVERVSLRQ